MELTGGDKLEAKLAELSKRVSNAATLRVGFLEDAKYPDGTSVAEVAVYQNYGAPARGIPPRPFFSNMIADNRAGWPDAIESVLKAVDFDARAALELFGEHVASQLREAIIELREPALSPVTLLLRQRFPTRDGMEFSDVLQAWRDVAAGEDIPSGHDNPLVWSGFMRQSVGVEVE